MAYTLTVKDHLPADVYRSAFGGRQDGLHPFFWDLECTGLRNKDSPPAIVEIAVIDGRDGSAFSTLVNPSGAHMQPDAFAAHGISDGELADQPRLDDAWAAVTAWIAARAAGKTPALIGYNNFLYDCPVLIVDLLRFGKRIPAEYLFSDLFAHLKNPVQQRGRVPSPVLFVDELAAAPNRKLGTIYQNLFKEELEFDMHRALADTVATRRIWVKALIQYHGVAVDHGGGAWYRGIRLPTKKQHEVRGTAQSWHQQRIRHADGRVTAEVAADVFRNLFGGRSANNTGDVAASSVDGGGGQTSRAADSRLHDSGASAAAAPRPASSAAAPLPLPPVVAVPALLVPVAGAGAFATNIAARLNARRLEAAAACAVGGAAAAGRAAGAGAAPVSAGPAASTSGPGHQAGTVDRAAASQPPAAAVQVADSERILFRSKKGGVTASSPVTLLDGIGKVTSEAMNGAGVATVGQLAQRYLQGVPGLRAAAPAAADRDRIEELDASFRVFLTGLGVWNQQQIRGILEQVRTCAAAASIG